METKKQLRLHRLRDITLYHLKNHEGIESGKTTLGQLDELEHDICVWVKNLLLTLDELDATAEVNFIGEAGAYEEVEGGDK